MRKNPDNKPLRIVHTGNIHEIFHESYVAALSRLVLAEAMLVKAGKDSAMPHFIAIVKELERRCGFRFEQIEE